MFISCFPELGDAGSGAGDTDGYITGFSRCSHGLVGDCEFRVVAGSVEFVHGLAACRHSSMDLLLESNQTQIGRRMKLLKDSRVPAASFICHIERRGDTAGGGPGEYNIPAIKLLAAIQKRHIVMAGYKMELANAGNRAATGGVFLAYHKAGSTLWSRDGSQTQKGYGSYLRGVCGTG